MADVYSLPNKAPVRHNASRASPTTCENQDDETVRHGLVNIKCHTLHKDGKGTVIVNITSQDKQSVSRLPARVVVLVETSKTMLSTMRRDSAFTKLDTMKKIVKALIDYLSGDDMISLVTFSETARCILPLEYISFETKGKWYEALDKLEEECKSDAVNLSTGIKTALNTFPLEGAADILKYRNAIIICCDGELNAGTTEPRRLVHETRQRIRNKAPELDDSQNQWTTVSVLTTGGAISDATYLLSKACSGEGFFYLNDLSEAGLRRLLPVVLRSNAVAYNVSLLAETMEDVPLLSDECTQNYKIRLRRNSRKDQDASLTRMEKAYFFYDFAANTLKQVCIVMDLQAAKPDQDVLKLKLKYFSPFGENTIEHVVKCADVMFLDKDEQREAISAACLYEAHNLSQDFLQRAADHAKDHEPNASITMVSDGKSEVNKLCEKFSKMAEEVDLQKPDLTAQVQSVVSTMQLLIDSMHQKLPDDNVHQWAMINSASSVITTDLHGSSEA